MQRVHRMDRKGVRFQVRGALHQNDGRRHWLYRCRMGIHAFPAEKRRGNRNAIYDTQKGDVAWRAQNCRCGHIAWSDAENRGGTAETRPHARKPSLWEPTKPRLPRGGVARGGGLLPGREDIRVHKYTLITKKLTSATLAAAIGPSSTLKCRNPSVGLSGYGGTT